MLKTILRRIATVVVPFIGAILMRLIYWSARKTFHPPKVIPDSPCIVGFWHGELLLQPFNYRNWKKKPNIAVMISEHFDGQLIASTMSYFGFRTIRGSSRSGAARVLMQAIKEVKAGSDIGITPDGPRGPRFSITEGIVVIAQKTDAYIVLQNYQPDRYWQLGSWDKFVIPKPFCRIDFYATEPFKVTGMEMEEAKQLIHDKLMQKSVI